MSKTNSNFGLALRLIPIIACMEREAITGTSPVIHATFDWRDGNRAMNHLIQNFTPWAGPRIRCDRAQESLGGERQAHALDKVGAHRLGRATQRSPAGPLRFPAAHGLCLVGSPRRCTMVSPVSRSFASALRRPKHSLAQFSGTAPWKAMWLGETTLFPVSFSWVSLQIRLM
jgi:hypothetical protein